jgi:lysyl-tRNA synthetase class II
VSDDTTTTAPEQAGGETASAESLHHLEQQRRANRDAVRALGVDPYGSRTPGLISLAEALAAYDEAADAANQASVSAQKQAKKDGAGDDELPAVVDDRPRVKIAGRVVLHRDNGKLVWINLRDDSAESFQVAVSKRDCDELGFGVAKATDLGDVVVGRGPAHAHEDGRGHASGPSRCAR